MAFLREKNKTTHCHSRDFEGRKMGITANSLVVTQLFFVIKNFKKLHFLNLLASRKPHLLFILNQSKADM